MLAKKHEKHDWYIKIQIEDHQKYSDVLDYISNLKFDDADFYMKKYGQILLEKLPVESTQFLKKLCTNYKPENSPLVTENMIAGIQDIRWQKNSLEVNNCRKFRYSIEIRAGRFYSSFSKQFKVFGGVFRTFNSRRLFFKRFGLWNSTGKLLACLVWYWRYDFLLIQTKLFKCDLTFKLK